jgi:hypothetical protein
VRVLSRLFRGPISPLPPRGVRPRQTAVPWFTAGAVESAMLPGPDGSLSQGGMGGLLQAPLPWSRARPGLRGASLWAWSPATPARRDRDFRRASCLVCMGMPL